MKKHPLEGTVIGIPLGKQLFLTGLVTRQNKDILLGYFFRQTYRNLPTITEWRPSEVCLICLFSALGIKNKEWEIPIFKQRDPINESVYYAIAYDDNIISSKRYHVTEEEVEEYYRDGIYGYKAVEAVLPNKI